MNVNDAPLGLRIKVGIFALVAIAGGIAISLMVNDKPDLLRGCKLVYVSVQDASGLKTKSPVKSLGIQIGYLKSIDLLGDSVRIGICVTAPVEITPETRSLLKADGFLGDKFLELKPVKSNAGEVKINAVEPHKANLRTSLLQKVEELLLGSVAQAAPAAAVPPKPAPAPVPRRQEFTPKGEPIIPSAGEQRDMQQMMQEVNSLIQDLNSVSKGLKGAIKADELKDTLSKLNQTLENAANTLSPEGGLTKTAQKALIKLDDAIEQLRQILNRTNEGKGSIGKLLNDPVYADELLRSLKNLNRTINKYSGMRLNVDLGGSLLGGWTSGNRGWLKIGIWPKQDRYYLVGVSTDSRGKISTETVTSTTAGISSTVETTRVEPGGVQITVMLGKIYWRRLDLSVGLLYGDPAASIGINLGADGYEDRLVLRNDLYFAPDPAAQTTKVFGVRTRAQWFPSRSPYFENVYIEAGVETYRLVNNRFAYMVGAGLSFDDDDIKVLLSLR